MDNKLRLFIIDDDLDDCELFCEAVSDCFNSAECFTAYNGDDALRKLRNGMPNLPDFIFLDLNMPKMDGRECLIELKKDEKLKKIPVIIFSTFSSQRDKDETKNLGALKFITKPTSFQDLINEIKCVVVENWAHNSDFDN